MDDDVAQLLLELPWGYVTMVAKTPSSDALTKALAQNRLEIKNGMILRVPTALHKYIGGPGARRVVWDQPVPDLIDIAECVILKSGCSKIYDVTEGQSLVHHIMNATPVCKVAVIVFVKRTASHDWEMYTKMLSVPDTPEGIVKNAFWATGVRQFAYFAMAQKHDADILTAEPVTFDMYFTDH